MSSKGATGKTRFHGHNKMSFESSLRLKVVTATVACLMTATCLVDDRRFVTRGICTDNYGELLVASVVVKPRLSCVVRCSTLSKCKSLVYNPATGECRVNRFRVVFSSVCPLTLLYSEYQQPEPTDCVTSREYPNIRLCDGPGTHEGRLEVYHEGLWGTVCDDRISFVAAWDSLNANVVCRMFGYQYGTPRLGGYFGQGQGNIWMDDVQCTGTEATVFDCTRNPWGVDDCLHSEDVGVTCSTSTGP